MAQTVLPNESDGLVSGSFAAPPGLEETAREGFDDHSSLEAKREVILDDVRQAILADVDTKVSDKMKDLWSRGKQLLNQIEQENQQQTADFIAEISRCREKQESLSAEQAQLRHVLASMVQQLTMLGAFLGPGQGPLSVANPAKVAPPTPPSAPGLSLPIVTTANVPGSCASTSLSGETPSVSPSAVSGLQDSPADVLAAAFSNGVGALPLPVLPDFPFPQTGSACPTPVPSVATPLSLAEALSSDLPTSTTPLSLSNSLAQSPAELPLKMFSFTLRKADNTDLGLNVSHRNEDKVLRVEGVRADGAVEAWNRQCIGSAAAGKAVMPGDRIISVNGVVYNPVKMLEECRDRQLLKLTIVRGDGPLPGTPGVAKTTTLRADASEFVPTGLASESTIPKEDEKLKKPETVSKTEPESVET